MQNSKIYPKVAKDFTYFTKDLTYFTLTRYGCMFVRNVYHSVRTEGEQIASSMAKKRIILLLDGTWNDSDAGPIDTNIVRLRELIARSLDRKSELTKHVTAVLDGTPKLVAGRTFGGATEHLVFYERGVGTGTFFDHLKGGAFGEGLSANVRRAYKFLSFFYEAEDEVFIFGFSRGAYTARSLIGLIGAAGLLKREDCTPELEKKVWEFYREAPSDRSPGIWSDLSSIVHPRETLRIQCVGVFDTVGALGIPLHFFWKENRARYEFHNVDLSSITNVNLHALAIDEHREPFQATVWRKPKFKSFATVTEQVWFAGVHSDVGGGYINEELRQLDRIIALDDITLDWMLKRLVKHFPDFPFEPTCWKDIDRSSALAPQHESRTGYYRCMPLSLRSIANFPVSTRKWRMEREVSRDRHAEMIGESVHISSLMRIGEVIQRGARQNIYVPPNFISILNILSSTYDEGSPPLGSPLHVIDWSGEELDPADSSSRHTVVDLIQGAKRRLGMSM